MAVNKKAVGLKIEDIIKGYISSSIEGVYKHLYEDVSKMDLPSTLSYLPAALSYIHQRINVLFDYMRYRSDEKRYFPVDSSRELIQVIKDIEELRELLSLLGYTLMIDSDYLNHMQHVKNFIKSGVKNSIPINYKRITIKDVHPIFNFPEKGKIIESHSIEKITQETAKENIQKCKDRIDQGDYSGAITISRTLVEAIIKEIYKKITNEEMDKSGNLPRYWGTLASKLNLHIEESSPQFLKKILSGLNSTVEGLATMRNQMSDSHGHRDSEPHKPEKHHAVLAVNCAMTITSFLFDVYEYQVDKGLIKLWYNPGMSKSETLEAYIVSLSESDSFQQAKEEWTLFNVEFSEQEGGSVCPCGQTGIRELCYIRNTENKKEIFVGNVCVNKFMDINTGNFFDGIKRLRKNPESNPNQDVIDFAWKFGYLYGENEYNFLCDIKRKRKLTPDQESWRAKANRRILKGIVVRRPSLKNKEL